MTDQPEKLDLRSQDITEDNRQEILRLFPEIRTEGTPGAPYSPPWPS
jgi:adenine-specific DNA-methyltransferase